MRRRCTSAGLVRSKLRTNKREENSVGLCKTLTHKQRFVKPSHAEVGLEP